MKLKFFTMVCFCLSVSMAQDIRAQKNLKDWAVGSEHEVWIALGDWVPYPLDHESLEYTIHPQYRDLENQMLSHLQRIRAFILENKFQDYHQVLSLAATVKINSKAFPMHGFASCNGYTNIQDPIYKSTGDEPLPADLTLAYGYFPRVTQGNSFYEKHLKDITPIDPLYTMVIDSLNENLCHRILEQWKQCDWLIIRGLVTRNEQRQQAHGFNQEIKGYFERSIVHLDYSSHQFVCKS